MSVTLERLPDGIAVLHGVNSPAALTHLSRSMREGAAFDDLRGLVVDLGGRTADDRLLATLDDAVEACLRRRQVLAFAPDRAHTRAGAEAVRRTLRLLDHERALQAALTVARIQAEMVSSAVTAAYQVAVVAGRAAGSIGRRPLHRLMGLYSSRQED